MAFNLYSPIMIGISLGILNEFFPSNLKTLCRLLTNEFRISKQQFYQVFNSVIFHMHYKNSSASEVNEEIFFFC